MNRIAERLKRDRRAAVRTPTGVRFTIVVREFAGVTGYGVIPAGRKRVSKDGHRMMSADDVAEWLSGLELDAEGKQ